MRFVKLAFISVVILFLVLTAIAALIPSTVVISRSTEINAALKVVEAEVTDITKWPHWLVNGDSSKIEFVQVGGKPGLRFKQTGIRLNAARDASVSTTWQANKGREMLCIIYLIPKGDAAVTTVQWQFIQQLKWYPWEKFSSIASEKVLGPYIEENLASLKHLLDNAD